MLKNNLIIHIPHCNTNFPKEFFNNVNIDKDTLQKENVFISDYYVDKLLPNKVGNIIKFEYSRLVCDVERFRNDELESMSKYGMGAVYTKDSNGNNFINFDDSYKKNILKNFYDKHHAKLDKLTTDILQQYGSCYILDWHSFSDQFVFKVLNKHTTPDICLGFEDVFVDKNWVRDTKQFFADCGYIVMCNHPYRGSLVPNKFFACDNGKIKTLMIEINKRIYLDDNSNINPTKFYKLKRCIEDYFKIVMKKYTK